MGLKGCVENPVVANVVSQAAAVERCGLDTPRGPRCKCVVPSSAGHVADDAEQVQLNLV